jgi:Leucine-rich repeat (LRR) protein
MLNMQTRRYYSFGIAFAAIALVFVGVCAHSGTIFLGGSLTDAADWDNGLPSSTNRGTVAVDGSAYTDIQDFDVLQIGGTITISSGLVGQQELRSTTWCLLGGTFRRTNIGLRIGGGSSDPSLFHVVDGTLSVTALDQPLIIYGGNSLLRITGGAVTASGTLKVDWKAGHDNGPFLEFGPGSGIATFSGLELGAAGYINFVSGSAGTLILTDGTITDNLHGAVNTFWELWDAGRLRIDGASDGAFNNRFQFSQNGATQTLALNNGSGPSPRITSVAQSGTLMQVDWNVLTNRWIIESAGSIDDLSSGAILADHSTAVPTNSTLLPVIGEAEFFRVLIGLRVLSGFTDTNLISAIKQIGLNSYGPESHVYDLDVVGLRALRVGDAGVVTVSGLNEVSDVVTLDLRDNPIVDGTPIGGMTQLQGLDLRGTSLEDTSALSGLTNLVWVGLSDNLITDLSGLAPLTGVEGFDLSGNLLADLSALASVSQATSLNLTGNGIGDLSGIGAVASLEFLNLHGNAVTDISAVSNLTSLGWLDLSGNVVSNLLPLAGLTNLSWVGLSGNALTNIAGLASSVRIEWLGLQDNMIDDLGGLGSLTNLTWLNLANNAVSGLGELAPLSNLRVIDVHSNHVTSLAGLEGLTQLDWLGVSENNIADLAPLVVNASVGGLGPGSVVYVGGNPLSAFALTNQIPVLSNTYGVIVHQN